MKFNPTPLEGVYVIELEPIADERGFFARGFCAKELSAQGLESSIVQGNISFNKIAGTVRGLHFQRAPAEEVKIVRCTRGSIVDVAVDLRPDSPTYLQHVVAELSADNRQALYIPRQFAHGFQTLEDDCEVSYLVSEYYTPASEGGLHHDDPALAIKWPHAITTVSDRDRAWPRLQV